jgi:hypothetical protein
MAQAQDGLMEVGTMGLGAFALPAGEWIQVVSRLLSPWRSKRPLKLSYMILNNVVTRQQSPDSVTSGFKFGSHGVRAPRLLEAHAL